MEPTDDREEGLFREALQRASGPERAAFLDRACMGDPALRRRLEALLQAHESPDPFLEPLAAPPANATAVLRPEEGPGTVIGRYKLLQQIGEGGCGVVYMAEQEAPMRRRVALKIIKLGMDTKQVVARFEAERQALAMMDHPNIAQVLDGGATEAGRPYFVMELVRGVRITDYCDQNNLPTAERLELFLQVCHAIQHAHQKGVIHRDIKPSNILVSLHDDVPVAKVIDFGIAKAIGHRLTDKTVFTRFEQFIGTPAYMSPEQAGVSGLDIDTRSDIYALGVLLYELLTGRTPFDPKQLAQAGLEEVLRRIREEEPPRPSTRLSTLEREELTTTAQRRQTEPLRLISLLRGDLDWIVMKCLEKNRTRRYETANALAQDIEHHLNQEPVTAAAPSALYRAGKFVRRHKAGLATATALVLLVAAGAVVSTWQAVRATRAESNEKAQRVLAESNEARALAGENLAKQQQQIAVQQKAEAERQRDAAERALYAANMQVAQHDWTTGQSYRLERLLDAHVPQPGRPDLRGWEWYYLFSLCHSERLALPCQYSFDWSADGRYLATADHIGLVNIWDVTSGERKASLKGYPTADHFNCISWAPDGKHIAAATDRGTIVIWEVASGARLRSLIGGGAAVSLVDWNPDGRRLASGADDGTISIWDWETGKTLSMLAVPAGPMYALDWHPDGRQLVAVYGPYREARELKIWDTDNGTEIARWPAGGGAAAAFSPDGSRLLWGINPVRVTDLKTRKVVSSFPVLEAFRSTWSPGGDRVASTCDGGAIRIWDAASGAELRSIQASLEQTMRIAWSPKGELLSAQYPGPPLKVWDTAPPREGVIFDGPRWAWVAFSPDGKRLLIAAQSEAPRIYDVATGEVTRCGQRRLDWLRRVAWSPDGKRFAASYYTGNTPARSVLICDAKTEEAILPPLECGGSPRSLAWNPDGTLLAVGLFKDEEALTYRGQVKLFSASTGKELAASSDFNGQKYDGTCESVAWSPDGKRLAAAGDPFRVFDSALHPQPFAATLGSCLDWSPDGRQLAAGNKHGTITVYDAPTGTLLHVLQGFGRVEAVRWHPSMPRLASGGADGIVRIWDGSTGLELFVFQAHTGNVRDLDWSPDGWRLATTGQEGSIRIWDASPADRFLRRHGDLRAKVWRTIGKYYVKEHKEAMREEFQEALNLLQRLRTLHPEENELQWQIQHVEWLRARQLARAGQTDEAIAIFKKLTAESPDLPDYQLQLPRILFDAGRETQAIEMLEKAVAEFPQRPEHREELAYLYECRAIQLCQLGELADAVSMLRKLDEAESVSRDLLPLTRQLPASALNEIAWQLAICPGPKLRDGTNAITLADKAVAATSRTNAMYLDTLAAAYAASGQFANAVRVEQEAIALLQDEEQKKDCASRLRLYESGSPYHDHGALAERTRTLLVAGKFAEAEPLARECLAMREKQIPEDWRRFNARNMLGASLLGQKKYAEAEPLLLSGYEGLKQRENQIPAAGKPRLKENLERLVQLYDATGHADRAAEWKRKLAEFEQAETGKEPAAPPR